MPTLSKTGILLSSQVTKNEVRHEGNNVEADEGAGEGSDDIDGSNVVADDVDSSREGYSAPNSILESSLNRSLLPPS